MCPTMAILYTSQNILSHLTNVLNYYFLSELREEYKDAWRRTRRTTRVFGKRTRTQIRGQPGFQERGQGHLDKDKKDSQGLREEDKDTWRRLNSPKHTHTLTLLTV